MPRRLALLAALSLVTGCERGSKAETGAASERAPKAAAEVDAGAVRASLVDGLEAAASDPAIAHRLGLARLLETPEAEAAIERLLARVSADPELDRVADGFFAALQDGDAMRAALLEYAEQHPELDVTGLTEGFVGHVDARLTRAEVAEQIEAELRAELRGLDPALADAWISDAGGGSAIATAALARFADPEVEAALHERLGRDPRAIQDRLERRLADPDRGGELVLALAPILASEAGATAIVAIVDHPRTAELLAAGLARALADDQVAARCEQLFGLALAPTFDEAAFGRALDGLLGEDVVVREAEALLAAIAREPAVRERVAEISASAASGPAFDALLLAAIE